MADTKALFKFGFLLRCAEEGLTTEQIDQRLDQILQKHAEEEGWLKTLWNNSTALLRTAAGAGAGYSVGGPHGAIAGAAAVNPATTQQGLMLGAKLLAGGVGVGALGGYGLAALTEDDKDPAVIKNQELADAYRQSAQYLHQQRLLNNVGRAPGRRFRSPSLT